MDTEINVTPMSSSTEGVSFIVQKLGEDVGPLKQTRELLINSFEAIADYLERNLDGKPFRGAVEVKPDPWYLKYENVRKIAYVDNGVGMDLHELRTYFNKLAESGKHRATDRNFGVGAKIATAAWNPYGVEIRSWKDGKGHLIRIAYNARRKLYGLEQFTAADGTFPDYIELTGHPQERDYKDPLIGDHGTMVVLLGKSLAEDTTKKPQTSEVAHEGYWFNHVANKQFFAIPHGIKLTSKLAMVGDKEHTRTINGYKHVLDEYSVKSGMHPLSDATVHWWILDKSKKIEIYRMRPYYSAFSGAKKHGIVAALWRGELFDFMDKDEAISMLQKFGVFAGFNEVVLIVEPMLTLAVTANLTRTSLLLPDGADLPWARWSGEFYEDMPPAIADYVEANQRLSSKSEDQFVQEQINKYRDLLQIVVRRPRKDGPETTTGDQEEGPDREPSGDKGTRKRATPAAVRRPGTQVLKAPGAMGALDVFASFKPKWEWCNEDEAGLEGRAARFVPERNFLAINNDFSVFQELVDRGLDLVDPAHHATVRPKVEAIAKQLYVTQLVWTVMSAMASFRNREHWQGEAFDKLISEEALTAAVLPRVYLLNDVKRYVKGNPTLKRFLAEPATPAEPEKVAS